MTGVQIIIVGYLSITQSALKALRGMQSLAYLLPIRYPNMCMTSRIGALIVVDREKAKEEILAAIDAAKGNRTYAAKALGVSVRGLQKWIFQLDLYPAIDRLCASKGYVVQPGPSRLPSKACEATKKTS